MELNIFDIYFIVITPTFSARDHSKSHDWIFQRLTGFPSISEICLIGFPGLKTLAL